MSFRIALAITSIALGGCASQTFINDVNFLDRHTEVVVIAPDRVSSAQIAICPALQGRVMTSTAAGPGGLSYGWINRDLIASGEKRKHINAYGGEDRFWLGPEGGQFSFFFAQGDPQDLTHWQTPAPVDSESFDVARRSGDSVLLRKKMTLVNASGTPFELEVQREIRALSGNDPGKMLGIQPTSFVRWVGYQSRNKITNTSDREWKRDSGLPSAWILGMFSPSPRATIVIPYKDGPVEKYGPVVNDAYFGKVPGDRLKVTPGVLYFKGDGLFRSKIGLPPRRSLGLLGCYDAENETLTVIQFKQPKGVTDYVNSMWEIQKDPFSGDAANSYNDGPASPGAAPLGPFYELESSSPALALKPGIAYTHDHTTFHFQGPIEELDQIATRVFGVGLAQITGAFPP
ncbi:MAG TPA: DUF6786 family protein [Planctomycetota bacterium]|jgi:hypothetical protein|nr:DUF6786 family protein [Planctomycetota bacterium]